LYKNRAEGRTDQFHNQESTTRVPGKRNICVGVEDVDAKLNFLGGHIKNIST